MENIKMEDLSVAEIIVHLHSASCREVDEFNNLADRLEAADEKIADMEKSLNHCQILLQKQELVIATAVEVKEADNTTISVITAKNKELHSLDPKRLLKLNKRYKETIEDLKKRLENSEKARKESNAALTELNKASQREGNSPFFVDANTKNAVRLAPGLTVSKNNEFNGVPGSPVVEFLHHSKGVSRQGTLLRDGTMGWADPTDSEPTEDISLVVREYLKDWCKTRKVKIK